MPKTANQLSKPIDIVRDNVRISWFAYFIKYPIQIK